MKKKNNNLIAFGAVGLSLLVLLLVLPTSNKAALDGKSFLEKYKQTSNAVLVDVRTPAEFNSGHISSAINIDYENPSFASEIQKLDSSKTYFIYCRSGNRSARAISVMKNDNIKNIYELQGGISSAPELLP